MATERIDILVSEKGAKVVKRNISDIGKTAEGSSKGVDLLKRVLGTLAAGAAIRKLVELVDTFTNLQNRLKLVTSGSGQLVLVTKKLFEISNRTRSSYAATGELFARVALAVKDLGISQAQTLQFTESLNQAVILSGASSQEAEAGIIQLSQGLASGALRGDELRSVLEQLPAVADVIAQELGVTRGELRKMGTEGKITAEIVLEAFKNAREELADKFGKTVPTIGQAFTVLNNKVIEFIGTIDTASGASSIISRTIIVLADNVGTLARILGAAGLAGAVALVAANLGKATAAVRLFTAAIFANPIGALIKVLLVVTSLAVTFSDKLRLGGDGASTLADVLLAAFNVASNALSSFLEKVNNLIGAISGLGSSFSGLGTIFGTAVDIVIGALDLLSNIVIGVITGIIRGFQILPEALSLIFGNGFEGAVGIVKEAANEIIEVINAISSFAGLGEIETFELSRIEANSATAFRNIGSAVKEGFLEGMEANVLSKTINAISGETVKVTQERLGREIVAAATSKFEETQLSKTGENKTTPATTETKGKTFSDLLKNLQQENTLLQMNTREREISAGVLQIENQLKRSLTETENAQVVALLKENRALEEQSSILDEINGPQETFKNSTAALNALLDKGAISAEQYSVKLRDLKLAALSTGTSLEDGLARGVLEINKQFTDVASLASETLVNAFGGAEDAIVGFVQTGKFEFSGLIDSIFSDLTRLAVRQAITAPIAGLFGSGGEPGKAGGGGGGLGSLISTVSGLFGGGAGAGTGTAGTGTAGAGGGGTAALLAGASSLFGFKDGGEFRVGGSGGPDSQLVAFKASPDETVTISKPGDGGGRPINIQFNFPNGDADSFQRNQGQILAKTQASLQRANARNN